MDKLYEQVVTNQYAGFLHKLRDGEMITGTKQTSSGEAEQSNVAFQMSCDIKAKMGERSL